MGVDEISAFEGHVMYRHPDAVDRHGDFELIAFGLCTFHLIPLYAFPITAQVIANPISDGIQLAILALDKLTTKHPRTGSNNPRSLGQPHST